MCYVRDKDFNKRPAFRLCNVKHLVFRTLGQAKRLIIIMIGFTVLIFGVAMIVLPGPTVVVVPVGLAILATEFIWARKLLDTVTERIRRMRKGLFD
jgi:tellurite resistance protein TerC